MAIPNRHGGVCGFRRAGPSVHQFLEGADSGEALLVNYRNWRSLGVGISVAYFSDGFQSESLPRGSA